LVPTFSELAAWIRRSEIGRAAPLETPFGPRRLFYADLTASGRALSFVEERIADLGRKGSWPDILADLDSLTETKVAQDDKCFLLRSPPRPAASLALSATGVALPPTVRQVNQA